MRTAAALLKLTRFPLVFTAIADSAVGASLAGINLVNCLTWVPAAAASAFLYAGGMALNDIVDVERDRDLHPERPLPSGRVSLKAAGILVLVCFAFAVASAQVAGHVAAAWVGLMIVLIAAYNGILKRWAVPGSLAMAAVRGANLGLGAIVVGVLPGRLEFPWPAAAVLGGYVFALTLWSTREDVRGQGRGALAVIGALLAWMPVAGAIKEVPARWASLAASIWILPWILRALVRPEPARLMQVVRWGVLGIIVLDASFLAARSRWTEAGAVGGLIAPALLLLPMFRKL
jgi:4-hydroxybenzoate polyprenyltransferase